MSDFTPRANLRLPGGGSTGTILPDEQVDIDVLNDNFRKIDALLGARNIPSASSYSGSMDGDLVYARDTEFLHMFSTTAGGLITPRLPGARQYSGTQAERVAFVSKAKGGDLWRDTDNIGVIWVLKAGTPNTWIYSGNKLRGDRTAMDKLVTDGMAVEGMTVFNTTDNSGYVHASAGWVFDAVAQRPVTLAVTGIASASMTARWSAAGGLVSVSAQLAVTKLWSQFTGPVTISVPHGGLLGNLSTVYGTAMIVDISSGAIYQGVVRRNDATSVTVEWVESSATPARLRALPGAVGIPLTNGVTLVAEFSYYPG
jgi:hypothetical protein